MDPERFQKGRMMTTKLRLSAWAVALMVTGAAVAQTDSNETTAPSAPATTTIAPLSPGQARVAAKVAAPFATMAGSPENAVALATALRTGTTATLSYGSANGNATTQTLVPPTRPMGWGNVKHALALAQYSLSQSGVSNPTAADLQAALLGGSITGADGNTVSLTGVLGQRASGSGWGQIAKGLGTTMGAVHRGLNVASTTPQTAAPTPQTGNGNVAIDANGSTTTGAARIGTTGSRGLVTASGTQSGTGHGSEGITTASGAVAGRSSGVVTAETGRGSGHGNARGHGIVNAAGGSAASVAAIGSRGGASAGAVTAAGSAARGVVTAHPGQGHGQGGGNGHAKGKGG